MKINKPSIIFLIILILIMIFSWGLGLGISRRFEQIKRESYQVGRDSVTLEDICMEVEKVGMGTDFVKKVGFEIYECTISTGDWRKDWIIPENVEVIEDEEGVIICPK